MMVDGDVEAQANAWRDVYAKLRTMGMDDFPMVSFTGHDCAMEFLDAIAAGRVSACCQTPCGKECPCCGHGGMRDAV